MDYHALYREKLTTAEEAVKVIRSGDWVDYGWCTGTPRALDRALAARYPELIDVKVRGGVIFEKPAICDVPDFTDHFVWNSWHMSGPDRKLAANGQAWYIPLRYSELPRYYRENAAPIRAAMFQVAPMDAFGNFNFGPNGSHMKAVCEKAEYVIVEVNANMPRCMGGWDECVNIRDVSFVVEGGNPPMWTLGSGAPSAVDHAVADLILPEIPDGACLQLGIGGMPNAVGSAIAESDLKDLGVHTEMLVDAFVDMAQAGKITGARKALDRGRMTYAFAAGSQKLYDFLHNNPACMTAPVDYVNDARTIAQLDNFISINNAVDLDLFGQVNAESSGTKHISGAGGQQDFVLGAYLSKGGKSFICCSSTVTVKDGTVSSRIRPTLSGGTVVTDTRTNIQYLVTEYGKVNLKGLSTWERAEKIISVCHPDFRDELISEAEKMRIWRNSNKR